MPTITASIVAYRTPADVLQRAIRSVLQSDFDGELHVVDNSPTDALRSFCHEVQYIFNGKNLGFGAAHNVAMRKCCDTSKYHLVLNPDVYFGSGVITGLVSFMDHNEAVGAVMPKILYPDGSLQHLCKLLPSPADLVLRRFLHGSFKKLLHHRMSVYELRHKSYDRVLSVPYLSGCFMLLRTSALKKVGLFDERIFMYIEDADLTRRIHRYFDTIYFPGVAAHHEYSRGSYKSFRLLTYHVAAAVYYFNKWGWFHDPERNRINSRVMMQEGKEITQNHSGSVFDLDQAGVPQAEVSFHD